MFSLNEKIVVKVIANNPSGLKIHQIINEIYKEYNIQLTPGEIREIVFGENGLKDQGLIEHSKTDFFYRITNNGVEFSKAIINPLNDTFIENVEDLSILLSRKYKIQEGLRKNGNVNFSLANATIDLLIEEILKKSKIVFKQAMDFPDLLEIVVQSDNNLLIDHLKGFPEWNKVMSFNQLQRHFITKTHKIDQVENKKELLIKEKLEEIWSDGYISDSEWQSLLELNRELDFDQWTLHKLLDEYKIKNKAEFNYQKILDFHFDFSEDVEFNNASSLVFDRYGVLMPKEVFETHKIAYKLLKQSNVQRNEITIRLSYCTYLVEFSKEMDKFNNEFEIMQIDKDYVKVFLPNELTKKLCLANNLIIDAISMDLLERDGDVNFNSFVRTRALVRENLSDQLDKELHSKFGLTL